jgi:hypothetical protein
MLNCTLLVVNLKEHVKVMHKCFLPFLIFASNIHFLFELLGGSVRKNYVEKLEECAITIEV